MKKIKLNLGCGNHYLENFCNIDLYANRVDIRDDIETLSIVRMTIGEGEVDKIYSAHSLMCIPEKRLLLALKTWRKLLKKNGKIIIETADFDRQIAEYNKDVKNTESVMRSIFGDGAQDGKGLRYQFNFYLLRVWLIKAGFKNIKKIKQPRHSRHKQEFNLVVQATK